jgi:hypothetical protein
LKNTTLGGIWWEWINKWGTTFYNLSASEIWSKNRDEFLVGGLIRRGTTKIIELNNLELL